MLFAIYPFIEKVFNKSWKRLVFAAALLLLSAIVKLPDTFLLNNSLVYYIPYFILGDCAKPIIFEGKYGKKHKVWHAFGSLIVYWGINAVEMLKMFEIGNTLRYVRAVAISIFLYLCMISIKDLWDANRLTNWVHNLLVDSSKFSLQFYLFNGYLLAFFRIIICSVLHISSPIMIVLEIWIGDVVTTLIICKWFIPKIPKAGFFCGIESSVYSG